jgi:hypothetical protein
MPETIAERVARGAALLDEKRPEWAAKVVPGRLRMGSFCDCVLGQVYGDYVDGIRQIMNDEFSSDESRERRISHGFTLRSADRTRSWNELRAAWLAEIESRRAQPQPATT